MITKNLAKVSKCFLRIQCLTGDSFSFDELILKTIKTFRKRMFF